MIFHKPFSPRDSFTLIELLIVLAIVAILSVVVILTLNPSELLKQSRDSNRLSDLGTLNNALGLFNGDVNGGFMGSSSIVYVSIPDASSTCSHLGLPTLPAGWSYACVTATSTRNTDGTGWIPVNFSLMSYGRPIPALPIDPINTTATGQYYTYVAGGSWQLASKLESQKYQPKAALTNDYDLGLYVLGTNTNLAPFVGGLVGWWKFDEGSGAAVVDSSGNGNIGAWHGISGYSTGHNQTWAGAFDGASAYTTVPPVVPLGTKPKSIILWFETSQVSFPDTFAGIITQGSVNAGLINFSMYLTSSGKLESSPGSGMNKITTASAVNDGNWHFAVLTYDGSVRKMYYEGSLAGSSTETLVVDIGSDNKVDIGGYWGRATQHGYFNGLIEGVRIYNRALSAAEILALYNATK